MLRHELVAGRLLDDAGEPLAGLRVEARQRTLLGGDVVMAAGRADRDGRFQLRFARTLLREASLRPALRLTILDPRGVRPIAERDLRALEPRSFDAGDVVLPRADVHGWSVTLGTGAPVRVSEGNALRMLVDSPEAFGPMLDAIRGAKKRVRLLQLLFKTDFTPQTGVNLIDALRDVACSGVDVRVLLNDNVVAPDDVGSARDAFDGCPVEVRGFPLRPGVMHAKTLVVDDEAAFLVGPPFQQRFWDTRRHALLDARRGQLQPNHDLVLELRGPVVRELNALFAQLWNARGGAGPDEAVAPAPAPAGGVALQAVRTLPRGIGSPEGERGCLEAHLRALANARHFLYHENQYFTSGAFVDALGRALDEAPGLDAILVLNESTDVPTYNPTQALRLRELGTRPNLGLFSLWSVGELDGKKGLAPVYVHSKAAVADDAWAMLGSANLDGIGLEGARELAVPRALSIELNLAILDGIDGHPRVDLVPKLRADLWAEHLGMPPSELQRPPPGGWLALWRRVADENLRRVRAGDLRLQGHVLPFDPAVPAKQVLPVGP